jgi:antitoxin component YwqK of YwqJK toxin-antitoxin module
MKKTGIILLTLLLVSAGNIYAQLLPPDSIPVFMADSLKGVYIYADTGTALNKIDAQGRRQGLWEKRYDDGNLKYRGHFWDDKPSGVFKNYYDDGDSLEAIRVFSEDGNVAYAHLFYTTGALWAEGKYVNQTKDSIWKYYNEAQQLILKDQFKMGMLEGKQVVFYPSGNPLQVKNWHNNLAEGPYQQYFDEGGIKEEGTFVHNLLEDTLYIYNPDGKITIKGRYLHDMKEGNWLYYADDGSKVDTLIYHRGKCLNIDKYTPTKHQTDSLKLHYQQLQQQLDHPGSLEDEYKQPGGEQ